MATPRHASSSPLPEQLFHELATTLEFDRFFLNAARAAALAVDADYAGLVRRHGEQLRYQLFFALDPGGGDPQPVRWAGGPDTAGPIPGLGETLYAAGPIPDPLAVPEFAALGVASHLVVPMRIAGRVEGALVLAWRRRLPRAPGRRKLGLVEALTAFMGNACYRSALEAALTRDARQDTLTGLPNRAVLMDRLAHARGRAARDDRLLVIALLDIDGFKGINDELGHEAGDHLLTSVAGRLTESLRLADTVGRYGGDEFVILMEDITHLEQVETILTRVLRAVRQPILFQGHTLGITISAGLTIYPFDDHPPEVLLQHADQAMYEAKRDGGDQYRCFERANTARLTLRTQLRRDIERALEGDLWRPHYQPIVDRAGRTVGLEARLRWRRTNGTTVREEAVSDLTEGTLRRQLLDRLLASTRRDWTTHGPPPVPLHINIHAADLYDPRLPARLTDWREDIYGGDFPVALELPDEALLAHPQAVQRLAATLNEQGFRLLVDHFRGHRRASLTHISATPLHGVKCDPADNPAAARLLRALTAGIAALGLPLYACRVDDPAGQQAADLLGCCYGQGLALAPELDARSIAQWLKTVRHPA